MDPVSDLKLALELDRELGQVLGQVLDLGLVLE